MAETREEALAVWLMLAWRKPPHRSGWTQGTAFHPRNVVSATKKVSFNTHGRPSHSELLASVVEARARHARSLQLGFHRRRCQRQWDSRQSHPAHRLR